MDDDQDGEDLRESFRVIQENSRPWSGYWAWRDKPVMEREAAHEVLTTLGLEPLNLRSRPEGQEPPDCEAIIDGKRCGIEVTELIHRKTLERSFRAKRARKAGRVPPKSEVEAYRRWLQIGRASCRERV